MRIALAPILVFPDHFMATKVKKAPKAASKKVSAKATPAIRKAGSSPKVRYVYYFGDGKADGHGKMKPLLGGKGANLHEMTRIGLPFLPGSRSAQRFALTFLRTRKVILPS